MKLLLLAVIIIAAFWLLRRHYSAVGKWLYNTAMATEAALYGFRKQSVAIGDMHLTCYRNHNPGKPVLVMLHGFSADKTVWLRFARPLAKDYDIVIPDMAGHGDSPYDPQWNYGMPAQAERLQQLLETLNIPRAHLIGNSMGGFLAATFAIRYPQKTLSATMVDPAGVHAPQASKMMQMLEQGRNPFIINSRAEFDEFYAMTMEQPPFVPDIVLQAVYEKYRGSQQQLERIFADFYSSDYLEESLGQLTVPAMLWWGDQDKLLHVSSVAVWQAGIPHLRVEVFPGIGHMPMVEMPARTAQLYRSFLDSL